MGKDLLQATNEMLQMVGTFKDSSELLLQLDTNLSKTMVKIIRL